MEKPGSPSLMPPPTPGSRAGSAGSGSGPRSVVGAATLMNFGKGDNENQDAYFASSSGSKCFVSVLDGHGEKGKSMSNFARASLARSLFTHKEFHSDPASALEHAYHTTQQHIERDHQQDAVQSGTTAVSAYQHRDRLYVANVGDSRAVLGRCDTDRGRTMSAVDLSSDHKPSRPDEKKRVLAAGGTVDQMAFPVLHNGGIRWVRGGPDRVMDKNGMGGLAMSRSLGDLSLRPYVSSQPEVTERRLDDRDKLLVLGSDGVWDHMSSQEAVDIAGRHVDPAAAAREITNIAKRRWDKETGGQMSDDITAVVVKLEKDGQGAAAPGRGGSTPSRGQTPDRGVGHHDRGLGASAMAAAHHDRGGGLAAHAAHAAHPQRSSPPLMRGGPVGGSGSAAASSGGGGLDRAMDTAPGRRTGPITGIGGRSRSQIDSSPGSRSGSRGVIDSSPNRSRRVDNSPARGSGASGSFLGSGSQGGLHLGGGAHRKPSSSIGDQVPAAGRSSSGFRRG